MMMTNCVQYFCLYLLFRFYEPVIFQPNIIPVCVPDNDENFIGRTAYVTGWGRLYEGVYQSIQCFCFISYLLLIF